MGTLTVTFTGICTHFTNPAPGVPYRVVLVNATSGLTVAGVPIPPHFPTITITQPTPTTPPSTVTTGPFSLTGVTITLQNPSTTSLNPNLGGVPNLTSLMQPFEPLSVPSQQYVLEGIPQWAACYFDITSGSLTSFDNEGAVGVQWTVETNGDPSLAFTPFLGAPALAAGLTSPMTLPSGSILAVSNEAPPSEETSPMTHFLLHYLTATQLPSVPQTPPMQPLDRATVGGGCSNSNYP